MLLIDTFILALKNIWSNKMRTVLTMLGIIIGVTAVIVIVGLGNGMTQSVRDSFSSMGINSMSVSIWGRGSSRYASVDYMYQMVEDNSRYLSSISPNIQISSQIVKEGRDTYRYTGVYGVNEDYTAMANYTLADGRGLQYMDIKENKYVCVIGDYLAREGLPAHCVVELEDGVLKGTYQDRPVLLRWCGQNIFTAVDAKDPDKRVTTLRFYTRDGAAWGVKCGSRIYQRVK